MPGAFNLKSSFSSISASDISWMHRYINQNTAIMEETSYYGFILGHENIYEVIHVPEHLLCGLYMQVLFECIITLQLTKTGIESEP